MIKKLNYYIALVGKNPLPIYISGLEFIDANTKVYLLYTKEDCSASSEKVAKNIKASLINKDIVEDSISLVSCDKSNFVEIESSLEEIYKNIQDNLDRFDDMNVYIDYTGGTKMMSAVTYNYFKEKSSELGYINFFGIYVSSSAQRVFLNKLEYYERITSETYCFSNIAEKMKVDDNDIVSLHGFSLKNYNNKIIAINNEDNTEIDCELINISLDNFTIETTFAIELELNKNGKLKLGDLVGKYFKCKDISEKLGGSQCKINLLVNNDISNEFIDNFYNRIRNITNEKDNSDIKKKVKIKKL